MKSNLTFVKILSLVLCLALIFPSPIFADTANDYAGHWAEDSIKALYDKGFVTGYPDGTFKPEALISRAEFMAIINRAFDFNEKADISFKDVKEGEWHYEHVAKAVAAGYIKGFPDGTMRPTANISRQEAAVIIARILGLEENADTSVLANIKDADKIQQWSAKGISAVISNGYIKLNKENSFEPTKPLTRAEMAFAIEKSYVKHIKRTYAQPGIFTAGNVDGSVKIDNRDVTLLNSVINGDLILGEGIGDGDVHLINVTVKGETIVRGGGENSIVIENCQFSKIVIVKEDNKIRILAKGNTKVDEVDVQSGAKLESENLTGEGFGYVTIAEGLEGDALVELIGNFESVEVRAEGVKLQVSGGEIENLAVANTAANVEIELSEDAKVTTLQAQAPAKVTGEGKIETAQVSVSGTKIEVPVTKVEAPSGVKVDTPKPTPAPSTPSTGGSGGGGSSRRDRDDDDDDKPTRVAVTGVEINKTSLTLIEGDEYQLIADVKPSNATNKAVTWNSDNEAVATVDSTGKVTSVEPGEATITVTTKDGNKTATCEVVVLPESPTIVTLGEQIDKRWKDGVLTQKELDSITGEHRSISLDIELPGSVKIGYMDDNYDIVGYWMYLYFVDSNREEVYSTISPIDEEDIETGIKRKPISVEDIETRLLSGEKYTIYATIGYHEYDSVFESEKSNFVEITLELLKDIERTADSVTQDPGYVGGNGLKYVFDIESKTLTITQEDVGKPVPWTKGGAPHEGNWVGVAIKAPEGFSGDIVSLKIDGKEYSQPILSEQEQERKELWYYFDASKTTESTLVIDWGFGYKEETIKIVAEGLKLEAAPLKEIEREGNSVTQDPGYTGGYGLDYSFDAESKTLTISMKENGEAVPWTQGGAPHEGNWVGVAIKAPEGFEGDIKALTIDEKEYSQPILSEQEQERKELWYYFDASKTTESTLVIDWGFGYKEETITIKVGKLELEAVPASLESIESYGIHEGKVYAGYKLMAGEEQIELVASNIESMTVLEPKATEAKALTVGDDNDPYLWFNVEKEAGNYEYTVVTKGENSKTYKATLDWNKKINEVEFTATGEEGTRPDTDDTYVEYEIKVDGNRVSLAEGEVKLIAQKDSEDKWVELTPNTDETLWFKKDKESGSYEFFVVTSKGVMYKATLDWQKPDTTVPNIVEITPASGTTLSKWATITVEAEGEELDRLEIDIRKLNEAGTGGSHGQWLQFNVDTTENIEPNYVKTQYDQNTKTWTIEFDTTAQDPEDFVSGDKLFPDGRYKFYFRVHDKAGNVSAEWGEDVDTVEYKIDNTEPTVEVSVEPETLSQEAENLKLTFTVVDKSELAFLEIDHSLGKYSGTPKEEQLPEFKLYPQEDNPWGTEASKQLAEEMYGVSATYESKTWEITFNKGVQVKNALKKIKEQDEFKIYYVVEDENGNRFGSMDPTSAKNTITIPITPKVTVYKFSYELPENVIAGVRHNVPVTIEPEIIGGNGYDKVRFNIDVTTPVDATLKLLAKDTNGVEHDIAQIGYWGPEDGFPIDPNYNETTDITAIFSTAGKYSITFSLVDLNGDEPKDIIVETVEIEVSAPEFNGSVSGVIETDENGAVTGSLNGDFNVTISGNVTEYENNRATFSGTISGDIEGNIEATINANGIDTLSGTVKNTGAKYPVRVIGIFPKSGTKGDFEGEIITGPQPTYVKSMNIITTDDVNTVTVGGTLQMNVEVLPDGASDEVIWSVWTAESGEIATIDENTGLLTGKKAGNVTVIAKALDGSLADAVMTITVTDDADQETLGESEGEFTDESGDQSDSMISPMGENESVSEVQQEEPEETRKEDMSTQNIQSPVQENEKLMENEESDVEETEATGEQESNDGEMSADENVSTVEGDTADEVAEDEGLTDDQKESVDGIDAEEQETKVEESFEEELVEDNDAEIEDEESANETEIEDEKDIEEEQVEDETDIENADDIVEEEEEL